jgi:hypothetical protein
MIIDLTEDEPNPTNSGSQKAGGVPADNFTSASRSEVPRNQHYVQATNQLSFNNALALAQMNQQITQMQQIPQQQLRRNLPNTVLNPQAAIPKRMKSKPYPNTAYNQQQPANPYHTNMQIRNPSGIPQDRYLQPGSNRHHLVILFEDFGDFFIIFFIFP